MQLFEEFVGSMSDAAASDVAMDRVFSSFPDGFGCSWFWVRMITLSVSESRLELLAVDVVVLGVSRPPLLFGADSACQFYWVDIKNCVKCFVDASSFSSTQLFLHQMTWSRAKVNFLWEQKSENTISSLNYYNIESNGLYCGSKRGPICLWPNEIHTFNSHESWSWRHEFPL